MQDNQKKDFLLELERLTDQLTERIPVYEEKYGALMFQGKRYMEVIQDDHQMVASMLTPLGPSHAGLHPTTRDSSTSALQTNNPQLLEPAAAVGSESRAVGSESGPQLEEEANQAINSINLAANHRARQQQQQAPVSASLGFEQIDTNGDGVISRSEWDAAIQVRSAQPSASRDVGSRQQALATVQDSTEFDPADVPVTLPPLAKPSWCEETDVRPGIATSVWPVTAATVRPVTATSLFDPSWEFDDFDDCPVVQPNPELRAQETIGATSSIQNNNWDNVKEDPSPRLSYGFGSPVWR